LFTDKAAVYKVDDLSMGKVSPMPSIGGSTLFLDIERGTSIQRGDIILSKSMTSSCRVMPTVESDTIVFFHQNYPWQYHLRTGNWSRIMGGCGVQDGYTIEGGCNCGLIYHIYHCCHCPVDMYSKLSCLDSLAMLYLVSPMVELYPIYIFKFKLEP
jgi:hypothetical protein